MSSSNNRPSLVVGIIALILGYGVGTAQHFFTKETLNKEVQNLKDDVRNAKGGKEALEKRANRLESQVYLEKAIDFLNSGDEKQARFYLGNSTVFFENGVLEKNPDHVAILESLRSTRESFSKDSLQQLRLKMARLSPPISAAAGGAAQ
jgi:hypothetical protein